MILDKKVLDKSYFYYHENLNDNINPSCKYGIWVPFFILQEDSIILSKVINSIGEDDMGDVLESILEKYDDTYYPYSIYVLLGLLNTIDMINEIEGEIICSHIEYIIQESIYKLRNEQQDYNISVGFIIFDVESIDKIFNKFKEVDQIKEDHIYDHDDQTKAWYSFKNAIQNSTGLFIYAMEYIKDIIIDIINKSGEKDVPDNIYDIIYKYRGAKNIYGMKGILKGYKNKKGNIKFHKKYFKYSEEFKVNTDGFDFEEIFSLFPDVQNIIDFEYILHEQSIHNALYYANLSIPEKIMLDVIIEKERDYENSIFGL